MKELREVSVLIPTKDPAYTRNGTPSIVTKFTIASFASIIFVPFERYTVPLITIGSSVLIGKYTFDDPIIALVRVTVLLEFTSTVVGVTTENVKLSIPAIGVFNNCATALPLTVVI